MNPIPPDHDTIVCHPDHADRLRAMVADLARHLDVVPCRELDPGQVFTLKAPQLPRILPPVFDEPIPVSEIQWAARRFTPPSPGYQMKVVVPTLDLVFVPESPRQNKARRELNQWMKRHSWRNQNVAFELRYLLDPTYRHPKRKRP